MLAAALILVGGATAVLAAPATTRVNFAGYKVLEITPNTDEGVELVRRLEAYDDATALDFWTTSSGKAGETVTVSVRPDVADPLGDLLTAHNVTVSVLADDLQALIDEEEIAMLEKGDADGQLVGRDPANSFDEANYNTFDQIVRHFDKLRTQFGGMLTHSSIGSTSEGRSIPMLKLSLGEPGKAAFWLDCGIHAREWVSPAFCMYAVRRMLASGADGPLRHFDFYVAPVLNPDGYTFTFKSNRMWRKNRSRATPRSGQNEIPDVEEALAAQTKANEEDQNADTKQFWGQGGSFGGIGGSQFFPGNWPGAGSQWGAGAAHPGQGRDCVGVDPNRNFGGPGYATVGSSSVCSAETYHGPQAFSEAESRAVRDAVNSIKAAGQRVAAFVTVHAYSQLWMTPYGYTSNKPDDYNDLLRVARKATSALRAPYGTQYEYGNTAEVIYEAGGSSMDWAYTTAKIKYAYALELRDKGRHGFILPLDQIVPTCLETYEGLKAMADEIAPEYK